VIEPVEVTWNPEGIEVIYACDKDYYVRSRGGITEEKVTEVKG